jgi:hypothetical protein
MSSLRGIMRDKIKAIIDDWDPADLLCINCPPDEYESEIEEIIKGLDNVKGVEELAIVIQDIFTSAFREEYPKWEYRQCLTIAEEIINLKSIN